MILIRLTPLNVTLSLCHGLDELVLENILKMKQQQQQQQTNSYLLGIIRDVT